jgi:hypothetical protein
LMPAMLMPLRHWLITQITEPTGYDSFHYIDIDIDTLRW